MKIFLDTNIFLEYFQRRQQYQSVSRIFDAIEDGSLKAVISSGSVYTLSYLIRMELKRKEIHRPQQTRQLRQLLNTITSMAKVIDITHKSFTEGINDTNFDDLEDSFQHQCAVKAKCDILITINKKHFICNDIVVMTPDEFLAKKN